MKSFMPSRMFDRVDGMEARIDRVEHGLEEVRQEVKEGFESIKQMLLSEMSHLNGRGTEADRTRG